MSRCADYRDSLVEAALGELSAVRRADLGRHLEDCAACREEAEAIRTSLTRVRQVLPAPPVDGLDIYMAIRPRLDAIDARRRGRDRARRTYRFAAGAAGLVVALVTVGIYVGLQLAPRSPAAPELRADADLARLIERSLPLVLTVANSGGEEVLPAGTDPEPVRVLAAELAGDARKLEAALAARGERRRERLVSDLAEVLEQVAAAGDVDRSQVWRGVRRTVEDRHLLFQVSAESMKGL